MCFCPDNAPDFYSEEKRRARKIHRCGECRSVIAVGETYTYTFLKSDGEVSHARTCTACDAWAAMFVKKQREVCGCGGWYVENLWGAIGAFAREHLGMPECEGEADCI